MNMIFFIIKYHFQGVFFEKGKYYVFLGNSQTLGLKNFWSNPVKTLHIHIGKYYLLTNSGGTDEPSDLGCVYHGLHCWHSVNILLWNLWCIYFGWDDQA